MHPEALGIDCVKEGFVMESCDPETLIPKKRYKVKKVNKINIEYIEVFFEESIDDIKVGDDMTEVSYVCDVIFENCTVRNNRARGMLLASGGRTVIRNNAFSTPGAAIKFESDGAYWFESGGVKDVLITGNLFDNCLYVEGAWGSKCIIDVMERRKIEEGKYFHKKIEISDNVFKNCRKPLASVNNTEHFIFKNNITDNCVGCEVITDYIRTKEM